MNDYEDEDWDEDDEEDEGDDEYDTPTGERGTRLQAAIARRARFQQFGVLLLIGGTILIAGSWADAVRPEIGWVGFALGMPGYCF